MNPWPRQDGRMGSSGAHRVVQARSTTQVFKTKNLSDMAAHIWNPSTHGQMKVPAH